MGPSPRSPLGPSPSPSPGSDDAQPAWIVGAEEKHPWHRKEPEVDTSRDDLSFMQFDAEKLMLNTQEFLPFVRKHQGTVTHSALQCWGVTREGYSVCCYIHGYRPFIYVNCPGTFTERHFPTFKRHLETALSTQYRRRQVGESVLDLEIVERTNIYHYQVDGKERFLRITLADHTLISRVRSIIEKGELPMSEFSNGYGRGVSTYDSNINYETRIMVDNDLTGCSWLTCPARRYHIRQDRSKRTRSQLEIDIAFEDIVTNDPNDDSNLANADLAPLRIFSFDIECTVANGRTGFPEPEHDPCIQIGCCVQEVGAENPFSRVVFCLNETADIVGAEVHSFHDEGQLLLKFLDYLQITDPDIITGYNINGFDIPYLFKRAAALGLKRKFGHWSRIFSQQCEPKDSTFSSNQVGTRESTETKMGGRIVIDMMQSIQSSYKLRSYSLNSVSFEYLEELKEDVHYSLIPVLFEQDAHTRRRLAVYCLKDAYLPLRLMNKLMVIYRLVEIARVCWVPISFLVNRGEGIKVMCQIHRKAHLDGIVVPNLPRLADTGDSYIGATVFKPDTGFYNEPITTLDFASLYPSIIIAHNLCYSTCVRECDLAKLSPDQYVKSPKTGVSAAGRDTFSYFVKPSVKRGVLPEVLEHLLAARKKARADMATVTDPILKRVLNSRQLALKLSANSVYGFTGATFGQLPMIQVSAAVTAFGRHMIDFTKREIEAQYCRANGFPADSQVIYGDTDSVMIRFGYTPTVAEAITAGREAAVFMTSKYQKPISLEFEKVYFPYLLLTKKRYAGLFFTKPDKWDKLDAKGLELVRRDNCPLVGMVMNRVLNLILIERSVDIATRFVKWVVSQLLRGKIDLSLLVISKGWTKKEYDGFQPHIECAKRVARRDPASAYNVGDRIPYVVVAGSRGSKIHERTEDPLYVLENEIPLDYQYYLHKQLEAPLTRLLEPVIGASGCNSLFQGDHTRFRSQRVNKAASSVLLKMVKIRQRCMSCGAPVDDEGALCVRCKERVTLLFAEKIAEVRRAEHAYGRVMSACLKCSDSSMNQLLCRSTDCPLFYLQKKVRIDLERGQSDIRRFSELNEPSDLSMDIEDFASWD